MKKVAKGDQQPPYVAKELEYRAAADQLSRTVTEALREWDAWMKRRATFAPPEALNRAIYDMVQAQASYLSTQ